MHRLQNLVRTTAGLTAISLHFLFFHSAFTVTLLFTLKTKDGKLFKTRLQVDKTGSRFSKKKKKKKRKKKKEERGKRRGRCRS